MSYNNAEIVHLWANQVKYSARNGKNSLSFQGRSLYSYHTEIARIIDGRAVYTSHNYSVTTSGKHQTHIPSAVSHLESYRVSREMYYLPDTWQEVAPVVFRDYFESMISQVEHIKRARSGFESSFQSFRQSAQELFNFFEKYHALITVTEFSLAERKILKNLVALAPNNSARYDLRKDQATIELCDRLFGLDVLKKLEQSEAHEERTRAKREREREAIELRMRARAEKQREAYEAWKRGECANTFGFSSLPVALRVKDRAVETSHGASVPLPEAIQLYRRVKQGEDVSGVRIGGYTVSHVAEDHIRIGCHKIPLAEADRLFGGSIGLELIQ